MKTCPKCGFENPEPNTSCVNCGATFRADPPPEVDNPNVSALLKEIEGLRQQLQGKDEELAALRQTLDSKDKELAGVQLQLTTATKELEDLQNKTQPTHGSVDPGVMSSEVNGKSADPAGTTKVVSQDMSGQSADPPGTTKDPHALVKNLEEKFEDEVEVIRDRLHIGGHAVSAVAIESYPLKKPEFHLEMKTSDKSLDLSTTAFHIRATLERTAEAIELLVQPGATVNVRMSDKQKWQRLTGGTRKAAAEGLILFDPTAAATARIGQAT